ncbi:hypothetical protein [Microvirga alba]|uniref:Tail fiber domain-containing protein n=1 Tax=Microvirga alba TaxID=2791025 RepID=A0A931BVM4_9HYPH|nr:hypothetical protein [Microvirga alba]MBF9234685.1 hypothetical protein [Microvirga alba]
MSSPFSGKAGRLASIWQAQYLQDQQGQIDKRIQDGQTQSLASLGKGFDAARSSYGDAIDLYSPYRETGLKAFGQYADATGVNGQDGYDRSVGNFRAGPGYEWQRDQGTDAVARKQSALGALGSGNTMTAIADYSSHLADQEYGNYLNRLKGVSDVGYNATGAQAGLTKGIGDLYAQQGAGEAGVYGDSTRLGVGTLANTTNGISNAVQGGMMAGQNAAANRWNMGMSLASLGASALGGLSGMPTNGSTLGSRMFGFGG